MFSPSLRLWGLVAAAALSAASLSACANNTNSEGASGSSSSASVKQDDKLAALVPAEIAKRGTLKVGTDPTYAPNEFRDDNDKIVGFDIDLFNAVSKKLGLKAEYTGSIFDNIIPGVQGGSYDVGVSSFTFTGKRREGGACLGSRVASPPEGWVCIPPTDFCKISVS